jgi:hypothetical protein
MSEIISCPSCQRKVQVPESLAGQDVQCPQCGATFVAQLGGAGAPARQAPERQAPERWEDVSAERPPSWSEPSPGYDRPSHDRPPYGERRDYGRQPYDDIGRFGARRRDFMPHRGGLILALGLIGILVCGFAAPFAWIMGNTDIAEIRAGRMDPDGEGLTQAGRILGIIGTVLTLLSVCGVGLLVLMSMAAAPSGRY